jgi:hypothetical protein
LSRLSPIISFISIEPVLVISFEIVGLAFLPIISTIFPFRRTESVKLSCAKHSASSFAVDGLSGILASPLNGNTLSTP